MRFVLFLLAVGAFLVGASLLSAAKTSIHEIQAFILFLICAVFVSGAAIVDAVNSVRKHLKSIEVMKDIPMKKSA